MQATAKMVGAHQKTSSEADKSTTSGARAMVMQGMETWTYMRMTATTRATLDERVPVRGMVDWSTICANEAELDRWSGTQARLARVEGRDTRRRPARSTPGLQAGAPEAVAGVQPPDRRLDAWEPQRWPVSSSSA